MSAQLFFLSQVSLVVLSYIWNERYGMQWGDGNVRKMLKLSLKWMHGIDLPAGIGHWMTLADPHVMQLCTVEHQMDTLAHATCQCESSNYHNPEDCMMKFCCTTHYLSLRAPWCIKIQHFSRLSSFVDTWAFGLHSRIFGNRTHLQLDIHCALEQRHS